MLVYISLCCQKKRKTHFKYIHARKHAFAHDRTRECKMLYTRTNAHAYAHASTHANVNGFTDVQMHMHTIILTVHMYAYIHTYTHTHLKTAQRELDNAGQPKNTNTHAISQIYRPVCAYIHTHIYTYIHT